MNASIYEKIMAVFQKLNVDLTFEELKNALPEGTFDDEKIGSDSFKIADTINYIMISRNLPYEAYMNSETGDIMIKALH